MTDMNEYLAESIITMLWYQTETSDGCLTVVDALQEAEDDFKDTNNLKAVAVVQFCREIASIKSELIS